MARVVKTPPVFERYLEHGGLVPYEAREARDARWASNMTGRWRCAACNAVYRRRPAGGRCGACASFAGSASASAAASASAPSGKEGRDV